MNLPTSLPQPISPDRLFMGVPAKVILFSDLRADYHTVFDSVVESMEGELFHIALTKDAKLFCVHTPHTITYTFWDKLKAELQLLREKNIITPVAEPAEGCGPIVVAPKKGTDINRNMRRPLSSE